MSTFKTPVFERSTVARQLADKLRSCIEKGQWYYGEQLPNMRQLAEQFEVSVSSAQGAVKILAQEDVLELVPRQGSFVKLETEAQDEKIDKTNEIGVIRPLESPAGPDAESWTETVLRSFELELAEHDKHMVMLSYHPFKENPLSQVCKRLDQCEGRLGGVVCQPTTWQQELFAELEKRGIPYVSINAPKRDSLYNFIAADYMGAGRKVGHCLGEQMRTNIWYLTHSFNKGISSKEKVTGLYEGLLEGGCLEPSIKVIFCDSWRQPDGYRAVKENIQIAREEGKDTPQAIFASGDFLSIGAIQACNKLGLSVPGDVAVIGSTGTQAAAYCSPSLSVVAQPMVQMGKAAANMLIKMVETGKTKIVGKRLPCKLIQRDSMPGLKEPRTKSRYDRDVVSGQENFDTGNYLQEFQIQTNTNHNPPANKNAVGSTPLRKTHEYSADNFINPLKQENSHDTHAQKNR